MVLKRVAVLCIATVVMLLSGCGSGVPGPRVIQPEGVHELTKADVDAWLDGKIPDALNNGKVPGAVVTVVHNGQVLTNRGYGYADTGADGAEPKPVDPEQALFRPGSISKIPTSIAVMQLVEQGKLDLDADISGYVDVTIDRKFPGNITLRNLLTHTAGFEERYQGILSDGRFPYDPESDVLTDPPVQVFAPGTTPSYSNYGMALAGYIVQQVSGERFEDYVQRHIFEPLGMDSSTYQQPLPEALANRLSAGYRTSDGPGLAFSTVSAPGGGMTTSGPDMARFMTAQLERSPKLLKETTWEQMWSPGLGSDSLGNLAKANPMGLGYFDENRNGHRIVGHGGDLPGYHSHFQIFPEDGTGVFVSLNGDGSGGSLGSVTGTIRSDLLEGFADRYYPGVRNQSQVSPEEAKEYAEQVAGSYVDARIPFSSYATSWGALFSTGTVTALDNGHLLFMNEEYEMAEPWVWQKLDGSTRLAAQVEDGTVVRIGSMSQSLIPQTFVQKTLLPVLIGSAVLLLLVIVAWPVGALQRWRAGRAGRRAAEPLPWTGRLARAGAVAAAGAVAGWFALFLAVTGMGASGTFLLSTRWIVRSIQVLQWCGVVAVIPAAMGLAGDVKRRAGWRRIVMASLLLAGLLGMAWWAWTSNVLSWDISV